MQDLIPALHVLRWRDVEQYGVLGQLSLYILKVNVTMKSAGTLHREELGN